MADNQSNQNRQRISRQVGMVPDTGFGKFLKLLHSVSERGIISLGVGEPDFKTPWHICEAAIAAMKSGQTGYTPTPGFPELRHKVAVYLEDRYGTSYDPETEIMITVGSSQAMDLALRTILDPGDEVIIPDPYYICYPPFITLAHGIPKPVPTRAENEFKLEADEVARRITPRTRAILFGYPANPTGTEMTRADLAAIAEIAAARDLMVISDEIYSRLIYGVEHTCFSSLPGTKDRTILLSGFSKTYAMTGWRLGYAAGPADLITGMTKIHQHTMLSPSGISQMAAIEAIEQGEGDISEMVAEYDRRRRLITDGLNRIGLTCHPPKGAFYVFPSVGITGLSSDDFTEKLLREEEVVVMPGSLFGAQGEGFVRCSYSASVADIEEALRRLGDFVARHRK